MTVGKFDREKFAEARKSTGRRRETLMGQLVVENRPLTKILVAQLLSISAPRPGVRSKLRVPGGDALDWEDAMSAGDLGMWKALENLDLEKGSFSGYALQKIRYELQCAVARAAVVRVGRGEENQVSAVHASTFLEEDGRDGFERLVHRHELEQDGPAIGHDEVVIARLDYEAAQERAQEPAVVSFVRDRLVFGRAFRVGRQTLIEAFTAHVHRHRGNLVISALWPVLRSRGARNMAVWDPWMARPVGGYGGVTLGSAYSQ